MKQETPPAEWIDVKALKPWAKNPRKNSEAVERVAKSIERFGFGAPIVARKENHEVIAGHTRLAAAKRLGMKTVPVRLLDVSERDARLLALADNKLGEVAEWDNMKLGEVLSEYSLADASFVGWDATDLAALLSINEPTKLDGAQKLTGGLTFSVVVECESEQQQAELLERLEQEGLTCKPLIS